jgi:hypothetical protein
LRHLDDCRRRERRRNQEKWEGEVELTGGTRSGEDGKEAWDVAYCWRMVLASFEMLLMDKAIASGKQNLLCPVPVFV